jgi:hypothetical protein
VAEAMEQAIAEATDDSSRTATFIVWRTRQILAERGHAGAEPSRATMFRLFSRLSAGRHTTGSAVTRRGLAGRPQRMFSQARPAAPGELMEIDSTPLDVLVLLDDGVPGRVQLTGIIDVATRTVPAAVIRPTTKSVDASVLLARAYHGPPGDAGPGTSAPARPGRKLTARDRRVAARTRAATASSSKAAALPEDVPPGQPVATAGDEPGPQQQDSGEPIAKVIPPDPVRPARTGKTTAITQLGKTLEVIHRQRHPRSGGDIPSSTSPSRPPRPPR